MAATKIIERLPKDGERVAVSDKRIETGGLSRTGLDLALRIAQRENAGKGRSNRADINQQLLKTGMNGGTEAED